MNNFGRNFLDITSIEGKREQTYLSEGADTFCWPSVFTANIKFDLHWIQVERLTVSVVAIVVKVDLIALRGKMIDVARRE